MNLPILAVVVLLYITALSACWLATPGDIPTVDDVERDRRAIVPLTGPLPREPRGMLP